MQHHPFTDAQQPGRMEDMISTFDLDSFLAAHEIASKSGSFSFSFSRRLAWVFTSSLILNGFSGTDPETATIHAAAAVAAATAAAALESVPGTAPTTPGLPKRKNKRSSKGKSISKKRVLYENSGSDAEGNRRARDPRVAAKRVRRAAAATRQPDVIPPPPVSVKEEASDTQLQDCPHHHRHRSPHVVVNIFHHPLDTLLHAPRCPVRDLETTAEMYRHCSDASCTCRLCL